MVIISRNKQVPNFDFNGLNSLKDFGVFLSGKPKIPTPELRIERITIPYRSSSLTRTGGDYDDVEVEVPLRIPLNGQPVETRLKSIGNWLSMKPSKIDSILLFSEYSSSNIQVSGIAPLEFEYHSGTDEYTTTVKFRCRPFTKGDQHTIMCGNQSPSSTTTIPSTGWNIFRPEKSITASSQSKWRIIQHSYAPSSYFLPRTYLTDANNTNVEEIKRLNSYDGFGVMGENILQRSLPVEQNIFPSFYDGFTHTNTTAVNSVTLRGTSLGKAVSSAFACTQGVLYRLNCKADTGVYIKVFDNTTKAQLASGTDVTFNTGTATTLYVEINFPSMTTPYKEVSKVMILRNLDYTGQFYPSFVNLCRTYVCLNIKEMFNEIEFDLGTSAKTNATSRSMTFSINLNIQVGDPTQKADVFLMNETHTGSINIGSATPDSKGLCSFSLSGTTVDTAVRNNIGLDGWLTLLVIQKTTKYETTFYTLDNISFGVNTPLVPKQNSEAYVKGNNRGTSPALPIIEVRPGNEGYPPTDPGKRDSSFSIISNGVYYGYQLKDIRTGIGESSAIPTYTIDSNTLTITKNLGGVITNANHILVGKFPEIPSGEFTLSQSDLRSCQIKWEDRNLM